MKKIALLLLSLCFASIAFAKEPAKAAKPGMFSHRLTIGYGYLAVPSDLRHWHARKWMPAYEFGFKDKWMLSISYVGYPKATSIHRKAPIWLPKNYDRDASELI